MQIHKIKNDKGEIELKTLHREHEWPQGKKKNRLKGMAKRKFKQQKFAELEHPKIQKHQKYKEFLTFGASKLFYVISTAQQLHRYSTKKAHDHSVCVHVINS